MGVQSFKTCFGTKEVGVQRGYRNRGACLKWPTKQHPYQSHEVRKKLIMGNGGTGIAFVSQCDPLTEGFEAMMSIDGKPYRVRIVAKVKKVENKDRKSVV